MAVAADDEAKRGDATGAKGRRDRAGAAGAGADGLVGGGTLNLVCRLTLAGGQEVEVKLAPEAAKSVELHRIDQQYTTIRTGIRCAAGCVVAYFIWRSVESLAGSETTLLVRASLNLLTSVSFAVPTALAVAFGGWGIGERKLRQRTVRQLQQHITKLETQIDPNRTSSGLTTEGKTHPRDRIK